MPLVGHAQGDDGIGGIDRVGAGGNRVGAEQRGIGAHNLIQQNSARARLGARTVGAAQGVRHRRDPLRIGEMADEHRFRHRQRITIAAVAGGDHQRKILHHIVGLRGHRIHIHRPAEDGDGVARAVRQGHEDVLDVVDGIKVRNRIGVSRIPGCAETAGARDIVAQVNRPSGQVGHDQVEVVDQFGGGDGVAGRIGPRQGHAQGLGGRAGVGGDGQQKSALIAGGKRIGGALVGKETGAGRVVLIGDGGRHGVGHARQPPALEINRIGNDQIIITHRTGPVNKQGLEQGRTGRGAEGVGEVILHQRQRSGHRRSRHARARFISIRGGQRGVEIAQNLKIIPLIIGRGDHRDQIVTDGKIIGVAHRIMNGRTQQRRDAADGNASVRRNGNGITR